VSDDIPGIAAARTRSALARAQFRSAAEDAFDWLSPSRLKAEATESTSSA